MSSSFCPMFPFRMAVLRLMSSCITTWISIVGAIQVGSVSFSQPVARQMQHKSAVMRMNCFILFGVIYVIRLENDTHTGSHLVLFEVDSVEAC